MPDAKSLLPGRAFRSEHAQLRPEPHSIASHGPAPMDPLQTTRMRNGVLYAAEWPCCHDPLRLSLGSEDPFYIITTHAFGARGCATPPPLFGCVAVGAPAARAECVRLPRARGGVRPTPSQNPCLLFPASTPPPRARSQAPARAWLPRKHTGVSFPSHHAAPGPSLLTLTLTLYPSELPSPNPSRPPLACVLPPPAHPRLHPSYHPPRQRCVLQVHAGTGPTYLWFAHRVRVRPRIFRTRMHRSPAPPR